MLRVRVGFVWLCPGQDLAMGHVALKKFNVFSQLCVLMLPPHGSAPERSALSIEIVPNPAYYLH